MITESFDCGSEPLISPRQVYGAQRHLCETCVVTFSSQIRDEALRSLPCEEIARIAACNGPIPIYALEHDGRRLAFYLSPVGAAMAATAMIEANWLCGARKFIMFGSAGCLDRAATAGKLVVATAAYRDEGMSYHYAPAADYIAVPGAQRVAEVFDTLHVPYVRGRAWTTDAFYRETRANLAARRREGCLAVDMELAGVQAVCTFHGFELYNFLMTGDVLDLPEWDVGELREVNHRFDNLRLALELAARI